MALHKPMVLVHESDPRFGAFDFRTARENAPPDLQDMLDNHESATRCPSAGEGTSVTECCRH